MTDRIQTSALRATLRRAAGLGLGCKSRPGNPLPCAPFDYRQLDRAADQLAQQLNDEAALRLSAEHALEVVADMLRGGDVDGAIRHIEDVLADRQLGTGVHRG